MPRDQVLIHVDGERATVTLNRPERRNALGLALLTELRDRLTEVAATDATCVVLAAAGPVFSAGHDLGELRGRNRDEVGEMLRVCTESDLTLKNFSRNSEEMQGRLKRAFKALFDGKDAIAVSTLSKCEEIATSMAKDAENLANQFKALSDTTEATLKETQKQEALSQDEEAKLKKQLDEYSALKARDEEMNTLLAQQVKDAKERYQEAAKQEKVAEKRAFHLAIASSIVTPLAQGLGAAAGAYAQMRSGAGAVAAVTQAAAVSTEVTAAEKAEAAKKAAEQKAKDKEKAAEQELKEASTKHEKAKKTLAKKNKAKAAAKSESESDGGDKKKKETLESATKEAVEAQAEFDAADKAKKDAEQKKAEASKDLAAVVASGAAAALQAVADNTSKQADNYSAIAVMRNGEKREYLKTMLELEQQKNKVSAALKSYAVTMAAMTTQTLDVKTTTAALFQAVGALKLIVSVLERARTFWRSMANACQQLSKSTLRDDIKVYKEDGSLAELFSDDAFKLSVVRLLCGWRALQLVCSEYSKEAALVGKQVDADFTKNPTVEESRKQAQEAGKALLDSVVVEMQEREKKMAQLQAAAAALPS
mgnify:CR=1 FL=1